ncbi:HYC_CC_PP family protein [Formosa algae]|uniref:HYC_CC_PP family protein n=1 Tax=Formosa algae TaxID=225843 RepID=UPI000CCEC000|nr:hypothetical protein [Formosa algae]PNW25909.1 hypothetical protein BKP44_18760 [Formosa algae]
MKTIFHNITAIFMAFVVLISTLSFSVDMHYCGDTLVDVAVFKDAEACVMDNMQTTPYESSITKTGCCTDHKVVVNGQDELQSSPDQLSVDHQLFITTFAYVYQHLLFESLPKQIIPFQDYHPPILVTDMQLEYDTFLI